MVRILANGDIVQDDDPRAQQPRERASGGPRGPRMGHVRHDDGGAGQGQYGQQGAMMGQQVSIFTVLNQKLLAMGFPKFNLGTTIGDIEPIVSVGFILAGSLFGLPGLVFAAILFAVCKVSMGGGQGQQGQTGGQTGQGQQGQYYNPPGGRR